MNKNILVLGASSGIGFDLVKTLLAQGHTVYCAARRFQRLKPLEELGAEIFKVDVRNNKDIVEMVDTMIQREGGIDIVYANAGYAIAGPVEETSIEKAKEQFDTNVFGAARVARAVLPHMREQKFGRIIFTTSIAGRVSTSMNSWYSSSKHALNGLIKGLAQEVSGFNIQVITIEPGCVQTEFDSIQLQDMLQTSSLPEYSTIVERSHAFLKRAYQNGSTSRSTVNTMLKAGFSHNPKLSYQSTWDAKLMYLVQLKIGEGRMGQGFLKIINSIKPRNKASRNTL
ncbi:SDR family oxidoreductase [Vibrio agarivorans]|uniref:SDR family oxidoreductase n=1 Tax=Vibrio agarivorans TaxID=153622 RepID=A0ABT7XZI1_9VIBR|nr:SDR family oxidoreductase [Vibrio agarivorans]MDN2481197.1 SDR family oxidoreductase [Vibrio agarivorans]